jgi:hypothetical protein
VLLAGKQWALPGSTECSNSIACDEGRPANRQNRGLCDKGSAEERIANQLGDLSKRSPSTTAAGQPIMNSGAPARYVAAMVAADVPDDVSNIVEFWNLVEPQRLTDVVDVGANPIDSDPLPYRPMLAAGLCRVTGFEPQPEGLLELQSNQGPQERYLPYTVGDGGAHTLNICRGSGLTNRFEPNPAVMDVFEVLSSCTRK